MQVLRLGDALPDMELLLPRGGGAAFALDMTEPDGTPTLVTGPVELVIDGAPVYTAAVEVISVINDLPVPEGTVGAVSVSRATFTLTGAGTSLMAYGPHRALIRYTPANGGPLVVAKGLATLQ